MLFFKINDRFALHYVFVVVIVSVLLSLALPHVLDLLRYMTGYSAFRFVFLNMTGTALAAMILGPWWGAAVGIVSVLINGTILTNYFPFGVVNTMGGVLLGYLVWSTSLRDHLRAFLVQKNLRSALILILVAGLITGVAAGILSTVAKLIIYPMFDLPLLRGPQVDFYLEERSWFENHNAGSGAPYLALLTVDILRDVADKLLSVFIALSVAVLIGARRIFLLADARRPSGGSLHQRLMTDRGSILFFLLLYGTYLLEAVIRKPMYSFGGGAPVLWTAQYNLDVWLLIPVLVAFLVLLFLPDDPTGVSKQLFRRRGEEETRLRRLADPLSNPKAIGAMLGRVKMVDTIFSVVFMLISIPFGNRDHTVVNQYFGKFLKLVPFGDWLSVLPAIIASHKSSSAIQPAIIYLGLLMIILPIFLFHQRRINRRIDGARTILQEAQIWGGATSDGTNTAHGFTAIQKAFENELVLGHQTCKTGGNVHYRIGRMLAGQQNRSVVMFVLDDARSLTPEVTETLSRVLRVASADAAVVLTSTPMPLQPPVLNWIIGERIGERDVYLLSGMDLESAAFEKCFGLSAEAVFWSSKIRLVSHLLEQAENLEMPTPVEFRHSAIDGILGALPTGGTVLDLSGGEALVSSSNLHTSAQILVPDESVWSPKKGLNPNSFGILSTDLRCKTIDLMLLPTLFTLGVYEHQFYDKLSSALELRTHSHTQLFMTAHFSTEQPARGSNQVRAQFELSLLDQVGEFGLFVERVTGPINLTNNVQAHTDTLHAGEPQMGDYDFCEYLIRPLL